MVLAALMGLIAVGAADQDAHLGQEQPTAQAIVLERVGGRSADLLTFRFVAGDGREVVAEAEVTSVEAEPGDTVEVRYDPVDPESYARPVAEGSYAPWIAVSAAMALGAFAYGAAGFAGRLPTWMLNR